MRIAVSYGRNHAEGREFLIFIIPFFGRFNKENLARVHVKKIKLIPLQKLAFCQNHPVSWSRHGETTATGLQLASHASKYICTRLLHDWSCCAKSHSLTVVLGVLKEGNFSKARN
jgi:hypothetical protein